MYNNWEELEESIENCKKCKLCKTRLNIVFGVGNKNADIMLIGEGPGADAHRDVGVCVFMGRLEGDEAFSLSLPENRDTIQLRNKRGAVQPWRPRFTWAAPS